MRQRSFEALFIRNIYAGFITCPSVLEAVAVRLSVTFILRSYAIDVLFTAP
jgi:hypothetical protein